MFTFFDPFHSTNMRYTPLTTGIGEGGRPATQATPPRTVGTNHAKNMGEANEGETSNPVDEPELRHSLPIELFPTKQDAGKWM